MKRGEDDVLCCVVWMRVLRSGVEKSGNIP